MSYSIPYWWSGWHHHFHFVMLKLNLCLQTNWTSSSFSRYLVNLNGNGKEWQRRTMLKILMLKQFLVHHLVPSKWFRLFLFCYLIIFSSFVTPNLKTSSQNHFPWQRKTYRNTWHDFYTHFQQLYRTHPAKIYYQSSMMTTELCEVLHVFEKMHNPIWRSCQF